MFDLFSKFKLLIFVVLTMCSLNVSALAQTAAPVSTDIPLKVSTRLVAPFAMKQDNKYTGFSMDLWKAIENELKRPATIVENNTLKDLLDSVENKDVDLAIAAISITAAREEKFDFSQPMFDSGLQIMVRADGNDSAFNLGAIRSLLTSGSMPTLWGLLALLIIIPAHFVWFFERRHPKSIVSHNYFPGIFQALWWATGAAHGQQLDFPKSTVGKTIAAMAIFVSVIFIAFFTANVTTALTVQQLKGDINGPEDLIGKRVATVANSTSAAYLRSNSVIPVSSASISDAYAALLAKEVDAVVYDAPILLYQAANEGKGKLNIVGPIFRKEAYGILFPRGSNLRKPVNEALLKIRENGTYDILYRKWFAKDERG
jgi:polar amino acid transport system substrate-binding protein